MDLGIHGKTALVLGAGGGLGGAIARTLAREGARIAAADIDSAALAASVEAIGKHGREAMPITWDIADLAVIDGRVKQIEGRFGSLDILVEFDGWAAPDSCSCLPCKLSGLICDWFNDSS